MIIFECFGISDVGCARATNEDSFLIYHLDRRSSKNNILVVIADGVGGHVAGRLASEKCVSKIKDEISKKITTQKPLLLKNAIQSAHEHLRNLIRDNPRLEGMGTTCTAVWIEKDEAYVGHVGDTRAYLVRNGNPVQITEDHTLVQRFVKKGIITEEEAESHPDRNLLTQALGVCNFLQIDIFHVPLQEKDVLLLCSDGLHDLVDNSEMASIVSMYSAEDATKRLVDLAKKRGGYDNITAIVIKSEISPQTSECDLSATREH